MNISVAMATYNGEKFIKEQLDSILDDISIDDEIIISDDGSTDATLDIINQYMIHYPNIFLYKGPCKGVFSNFENSISSCTKDIICLSDQDDIWIKGKKNKLLKIFEDENIELILHNATMFDSNGDSLQGYVRKRDGVFINLVKNCYWGCCMAFRKKFISKYLPFGFEGVAHDQLIGLLAEKEKCCYFLDDILTKHRIHGNNVSTPQNLIKKITFRINLTKDYQKALKKLKG